MTPAVLRTMLCGLWLAAWALLLARHDLSRLPALCTAAGGMSDLALLPARMDAMLRMTPLPGMLTGSALMLAAMMVPLVLRPVEQVRARGGSAMRFLAGYCLLWLPTVAVIGLWSTVLRLATIGTPMLGIAIALGIVTLWHATPLRARCIDACRRAPAPGNFRAGARQAAGCIGACSAAMALPPLFGPAHLAAMAIVAALLWHERRAGLRPGHAASPALPQGEG